MTGILHTISDTQSYSEMSNRSLKRRFPRTSTIPAISTFTPRAVKTKTACTSDATVVIIHVENIAMRRLRRHLSLITLNNSRGAMSSELSAITSAEM